MSDAKSAVFPACSRACASQPGGDRLRRFGLGPQLPPASFVAMQEGPGEEYVIGPLDELTVFVWRNPELGASVQVRPDGRITTPLITDMPAVGKTPSMLAEDIKLQLSQYIQEPLVSVIVNKFAGTFSQQVRIVGATEKPASIPYRANMTLLDAMIAVGGLSEFAAGNRAKPDPLRQGGRQAEGIRAAPGRPAQEGREQGQRDADAGRCDHHPREHVLRIRGRRLHELALRRTSYRLHSVWNRRWLALAVAWGVCLLGWLAVALMPNSYESKARIFIQLDDALAEQVGIGVADRKRDIERIRQTLTSAVNLEKVVRSTRLGDTVETPKQMEKAVPCARQGHQGGEPAGQPVRDHRRRQPARSPMPRTPSWRRTSPEDDRHLPRGKPSGGRGEMTETLDFVNQQLPREKELEAAEQRRQAFEAQHPDMIQGGAGGLQRLEARAPNCAASMPISPPRRARWPRSTASLPARRKTCRAARYGRPRGALGAGAEPILRPCGARADRQPSRRHQLKNQIAALRQARRPKAIGAARPTRLCLAAFDQGRSRSQRAGAAIAPRRAAGRYRLAHRAPDREPRDSPPKPSASTATTTCCASSTTSCCATARNCACAARSRPSARR
jgi:polysaccharide export outer membrane protein